MTKLRVIAPSNIALIKYMGKSDFSANLPANPSISMTLEGLCTEIEVEVDERSLYDRLESHPGISSSGVDRFLKHIERVRQGVQKIFPFYDLKQSLRRGGLVIRSSNTFPDSAGIASSASSFAALTLAVAALCAHDLEKFKKIYLDKKGLQEDLARLSRQGSGSSCRSFGGPWVFWCDEDVEPVLSHLPELVDFVLVVSESKKNVSSSEAHRRILTSPLWGGRSERASARADRLRSALVSGDYFLVSQIAWEESWEMHSLFHTSDPPFTYWQPSTLDILNFFMNEFSSQNRPIVTLDAGPNVHVLVPSVEELKWFELFRKKFPDIKILKSKQGLGARIESE